jgi:hypothetical protein
MTSGVSGDGGLGLAAAIGFTLTFGLLTTRCNVRVTSSKS